MLQVLLIAVGGAAGALLRHGACGLAKRMFGESYPWGTLLVNLAGCFVIGVVFQAFERVRPLPHVSGFLLVGLLGGFTTFSSFALECRNLMRSGALLSAGMHACVSVVGGVAMVLLGVAAMRLVQR